MKNKTLILATAVFGLIFLSAWPTAGCGGGGGTGGSGGGNNSHTHQLPSIFVVNDPWSSNMMSRWPSLSWTAATMSTAKTSGVGNFIYSIGFPVSTLGFAIQWYSRTDTYNWNGQGDPPFVNDTTLTVASAMTDRYFNDINNPENNVFFQGFYSIGWPNTLPFNQSLVDIINSNRPLVLHLGRSNGFGNYAFFVVVTGIQWKTDSNGVLLSVDGLYIYNPFAPYDPAGGLPTKLTAANTSTYGLTYLGFAWMTSVPGAKPSAPFKSGKTVEPVESGKTDSTQWPTALSTK